jgi:hypothetical protein
MEALRAALEVDPADVEQQQRIDSISGPLALLIKTHHKDVARIQRRLTKGVGGENPLLVLFCLHLLTASARRGMIATRAPGMLDLDAACIALADEMADFHENSGEP